MIVSATSLMAIDLSRQKICTDRVSRRATIRQASSGRFLRPTTSAPCRAGHRTPPGSSVDETYCSKEIHLSNVDAAATKHRVDHANVEVDVRNRHLDEVILSAYHLAGRPGEADLAILCAFVLRLGHAFREIDRFPDARAQFVQGLLIIFV